MFNFQKLNVYQKSLELSFELTKTAADFPHKFQRISNQLIGAATSIPLNVAEGNGRAGDKEKCQFFKIARGSAFETVPILELCLKLRLITDYDKWMSDIEEICKMLNGLIKNINNQKSEERSIH